MEHKKISRRFRLYQIVEIGAASDFASRFYDFASTGVLLFNLVLSMLLTFHNITASAGTALHLLERLTVAFFAVDYVLRIITAKCAHPELSEPKAAGKYIGSFYGIVDLASFLPYFLPVFFPTGAAVFRMFRVVRIFRLFRINAYYDSLNVITEVLRSKMRQIVSAMFIIVVLMFGCSLCMYSIEHSAQPDIFTNAFSGIWWAASTLLTIGYGDIYPITVPGQILSIIIGFLGVCLVAIPTGIISAGFVEQYSKLSQLGEDQEENNLHFIRLQLEEGDPWIGKQIADLHLSNELIPAMIHRNGEVVIPRKNVVLESHDTLILAAAPTEDDQPIEIKTVTIGQDHEWIGYPIRDLDISRQTLILTVRRDGQDLIPNGDLVILENDEVLMYSKLHLSRRDSHLYR